MVETAERTKPGDLIVVEAHHVGGPQRKGEILEVLGGPGREHFRVRWEDGTATIFYPSSDAKIKRAAATSAKEA
jgi:Domain of unknown function (DUF1918)